MILGIDEVGRGSLAGPLVVGVVCLKKPISGIKDSKQLSPKKRLMLSELINQRASVVRLGWVWPEEIDAIGLTEAMKLAINRAIKGLEISGYKIIIDGSINYLSHLDNADCKIKADTSVLSVSAASIVAKVARDKYMHEISDKYPVYDFRTNVGYGTPFHLTALAKYGPSIVHRKSFKLTKEVLN